MTSGSSPCLRHQWGWESFQIVAALLEYCWEAIRFIGKCQPVAQYRLVVQDTNEGTSALHSVALCGVKVGAVRRWFACNVCREASWKISTSQAVGIIERSKYDQSFTLADSGEQKLQDHDAMFADVQWRLDDYSSLWRSSHEMFCYDINGALAIWLNPHFFMLQRAGESGFVSTTEMETKATRHVKAPCRSFSISIVVWLLRLP